MTPLPDQPRVRANDWTVLDPPALGSWTPSLSVSVVIPTFRAYETLPLTLASLKAQSYPEDLLEVVVVDDGSQPAVELPELRPSRTRIIRTTGSWGRAHACRQGAEAAQGDVIHWLDADMVAYRRHIEAQLRWHHLIDYAVVLGHKMFIDPSRGPVPTPAEVFAAVGEDRADELFDGQESWPHDWVEARYDLTRDLADAGQDAYTVHVGATASVGAELYRRTGGMDSDLKLGEDIELGYRLSQQGAVFIPEREAKSWHVGATQVMKRRDDVNRYNAPFLTDRVSQLRYRRRRPGRSYSVPYLEVVVDCHDRSLEEVVSSVDGVLASSLSDVRCLLVGPWSSLADDRRSPVDDPRREARLIRADYEAEPRVELVETVPATAFPAAFRLHLPAGWAPGYSTLEDLLAQTESARHGLRLLLLPDGTVARLERTAAVTRALLVRAEGEELDDAVDEAYGSWWMDGEEAGLFREVEAPWRTGHSLVRDLHNQVSRLKAELGARGEQVAADPAVGQAGPDLPVRPWRIAFPLTGRGSQR